jgi:hypothetical protein
MHSGGEHQPAFYVAIGAALAATYRLQRQPGGRLEGGMVLAVFDEAFGKLDLQNTVNALEYPTTWDCRWCSPPRTGNAASSASTWIPSSMCTAAVVHQGLRRFLSKKLPACSSFRPPAVLRKGLHSPAMRPFARLAGRRKFCAIW